MGRRVSLTDVRAGYGRLEVLHGISATLPPATLTAILGPNGAGKTTLLRVLAGLLAPTHGEVRWDGTPMTGLTPFDRARTGLTYIPHVGGVFDNLTVAENLTLFATRAPTEEILELFPGLNGKLDRPAGSLSGGEHQMLALCRAFVRRSEVLLIDEAGAGLAGEITARVYEALAALAGDGTTVVIVDQYPDEALHHASVVYGMRRGSIVFAGEPGELTRGNTGAAEP
jgi:branched-chain amino acid transport system ATP-binding protein